MFGKQPKTVEKCFKCGKERNYTEIPEYGHGWTCKTCIDCKKEVKK